MVPRTSYGRALGWWDGARPISNHCPFCLSDNWDGSRPTIFQRLMRLLAGLAGISVCLLLGEVLLTLQAEVGIYHQYPWLTLSGWALAVLAGYRVAKWVDDY